MKKVIIDGNSLTIEDVVLVARGSVEDGEHRCPHVEISEEAKKKVKDSRAVVDHIVEQGLVRYGITTGFGQFQNSKILTPEDAELLQRNIALSHSAGVGDLFPIEIVRAIMFLRANTLAKGYSGVRLETLQLLIDMLNKGIYPVIPEQGSVGASGDLAPLAHMTASMIGHGSAVFGGEVYNSADALRKVGLEPIVLSYKEGLALTNGTQVMTAIGVLAYHDACRLVTTADIALSLTVQAVLGHTSPFMEFIHEARPYPGQQKAAKNMRQLCEGSMVLNLSENQAPEKRKESVQNSYSIRCAPQVHGAAWTNLSFIRQVLEIEINSATDNPLISIELGDSFSGGNFHGQPISQVMDFLKITMAEIGSISERRTFKLIDENHNGGLPECLIEPKGKSGLNSGFMIAQYTAAALVSENKVLCHPASVDSIPTASDSEDHVSMGPVAARQAREIIGNVTNVLAIEFLCACQAMDLRIKTGFKDFSGAAMKIRDEVRKFVPYLEQDEMLSDKISAVRKLISSNKIIEAVKEYIEF